MKIMRSKQSEKGQLNQDKIHQEVIENMLFNKKIRAKENRR